ncbi:MAG: hypothetical protein Kapaf2KO_05890 [Candidatus Kapaibacteriales bacterium]
MLHKYNKDLTEVSSIQLDLENSEIYWQNDTKVVLDKLNNQIILNDTLTYPQGTSLPSLKHLYGVYFFEINNKKYYVSNHNIFSGSFSTPLYINQDTVISFLQFQDKIELNIETSTDTLKLNSSLNGVSTFKKVDSKILLSSRINNKTEYQIIDIVTNYSKENIVGTSPELITLLGEKVAYIDDGKLIINQNSTILPTFLSNATKLTTTNISNQDYLTVLNGNSLAIYNENLDLQLYQSLEAKLNSETEIFLTQFYDKIIISDGNMVLTISLEQTPNYFIRSVFDKLIYIAIILISLIVVFYLYQKLQQSRRSSLELLRALEGYMLISFDSENKIVRINALASENFELTKGIQLANKEDQNIQDSISNQLLNILDRVKENKSPIKTKLHQTTEAKAREYICQANPILGTVGTYRGAVILCTDITEEFERRRLANWAQFAHDMQTNLSVIKLNVDELTKEDSLKENQNLERIKHQAEVLLNRVRDIVTVGRRSSDHKSVSAGAFISELEYEVKGLTNEFQVDYEFDDINIGVDKNKLLRASLNIIRNSIIAIEKAERKNGIIKVKIQKDHRMALISFEDNGIGMSKSVADNMMKPFFTTGSESGGSGIGTMVIYNVLEEYGGSIDIDSKLGKGTKVTLCLPLKRQSAQ